MDLISSPKTRAELPVTFAWLADTAIAKANKLQEKVGRLRVINDLVSEAEKKAGSPQIRPGANNVEKRFVRDGFDDYEYNDLKWYSKSSRKLALSKLKEQAKDWSLGPLFLIVPFGFVLATMQFQEMLQRIMFKFKG